MKDPHEDIEELLAGYALRSLDGEDARAAERLLAEHVPACARCRDSLAEFQQVAGELNLVAPPAEPPHLLLARLRKEIRQRRAPIRRRPVGAWVSAAAAVAVLGLAGWNAILDQRVSHEAGRSQKLEDATAFFADPAVQKVSLTAERHRPATVVLGYREAHVVLFGTNVTDPTGDRVYRLWLGKNGRFTPKRDFLPDDGLVVITLSFPVREYDEILITEEAPGEPARQPSGVRRWFGQLDAAA